MGAAIDGIEEKIGRRVISLYWILHANELPLRHLFTNLDEKTCGEDSFSGTYGVIASDSFIIMTNRSINCISFLLV